MTTRQVNEEQIIEQSQTKNALDKTFVGKFPKLATRPSVMNITVFVCQNAASTVISDFINGQDGQTINILGDGVTAITHGANIKTNTGANKVLDANKIYRLTRIAGVWYEDA